MKYFDRQEFTFGLFDSMSRWLGYFPVWYKDSLPCPSKSVEVCQNIAFMDWTRKYFDMPGLVTLTDNRETQTSKEAFRENIAPHWRPSVISNCFAIQSLSNKIKTLLKPFQIS